MSIGRGVTNSVLSALALPVLLFLVLFGLLLIGTAIGAPDDLSTRPVLRLAALFAGLLALVPAAATSLFLRLRQIDRRFHDEVTGGWHTAAYIVFVGGRAVFVNLQPSMRRIAANVVYPSGLRRFAKALCVYQFVAFIGLLACAALLMIQRAMV
jgi:hypothetical protein